jgi:drug/metabolite transporter (DMT)-like permease
MRVLPTLALVVGVLAVSTAPVLILLTGLDPYALAAWRLVCVALILTPLGGWRLWRDLKKLSARDRLLLVTSGVLYGAHFWLNERFTATMFWASLVATAGLTVFVWHDYTFDAAHLVGDALVIACGLAIVLSYSFGRVLRPRMSLGGYLGALYWIGGLTMLATALVAGNPLWGYAQDQWFWLALAVLIPTLVGHSLFHYVVRYVPVFYVNLTILGEPILSLLIMYALRDHYTVFATSTMTPLQIAGGSLLLLGVGIGLAFGRKDAAKERGS